MATTTNTTHVNFVKVPTMKKFNDIDPIAAGTIYFIVDAKKIHLDGVMYGFNDSDITGGMLYDIISTPNPTSNAVTVNVEDDVNGDLIITADVNLWDNPKNMLTKDLNGLLSVHFGNVEDIAHDTVIEMVIDKLGQTNGIASLDDTGKVPSAQLPSYVDDIIEYPNKASFPATGEAAKLYVDLSNSYMWRWGGSGYYNVSDGNAPLKLGSTSATAHRGDHGAAAYTHISKKDNPHAVTKDQVKLGSVENYGIASEAEAKAGTLLNKYMTPQRTKQAIETLAPKLTWTVVLLWYME